MPSIFSDFMLFLANFVFSCERSYSDYKSATSTSSSESLSSLSIASLLFAQPLFECTGVLLSVSGSISVVELSSTSSLTSILAKTKLLSFGLPARCCELDDYVMAGLMKFLGSVNEFVTALLPFLAAKKAAESTVWSPS